MSCHSVQNGYEVCDGYLAIAVDVGISGNFLACHRIQNGYAIGNCDIAIDVHIARLAVTT